jgi:aspartyl-tRNA(Asn)/glutamyl-tRNA(Gln) amidotransferase subunit B
MQEGSFRVDANVSVRPVGQREFGTRREIKNLNSFRFLEQAINFEARWQIEQIEDGHKIRQATVLFDPDTGETRMMRTKEDAHDYRYFPDPDLLPVRTGPILERMRPLVPELPHEKAARYEQHLGLTRYDAAVLSSDLALAAFFDAARAGHDGAAKKLANFIINTLLGALNERGIPLARIPLPPTSITTIVDLLEAGDLAHNQAREVLNALLDGPDPNANPAELARQLGFEPADAGALAALVDQTIAAHPDKAAAIRAGNEKLANWLTGQVMKAAHGKANPKQITALVRTRLGLE